MIPFSSSSFSSSSSLCSSSSSSSTLSKPTLSPERLSQRIYEVLTDKRSDDETVASHLLNAYSGGVTESIYEFVKNFVRRDGPEAIKISDGVKEMLTKRGVTLMQDESGNISMHKELIVELNDDKGASGTKVGRIEFSQRNEGAIFEALRYGSAVIKATIIRQAVQQGQEAFLNQLVPRFFLSGVSLVGLDLRKLNLEEAVLAGANLSKTNMEGMDLTHANLNDANLDDANLNGAVLLRTSFVTGSARGTSFNKANLEELCADGADLSAAHITNANCTHTRFVGANLTGTDMRTSLLDDAHFSGAKTTDTMFSDGFVIKPLQFIIDRTI